MTLHDEGVVELWDLSSNFVFSESDIGKNRALASAPKLQDLNNSVIVHTLTTKLVKEQLSEFEVYYPFAYFLLSEYTSDVELHVIIQKNTLEIAKGCDSKIASVELEALIDFKLIPFVFGCVAGKTTQIEICLYTACKIEN